MVFITRSELNQMGQNVIDEETGMTELDLFENDHAFEDWHVIEDEKEVKNV